MKFLRMVKLKEVRKLTRGEEYSKQRKIVLNTSPEARRVPAQQGGQCKRLS